MKANLHLDIFRWDKSPNRKPIEEIIALLPDKPEEFIKIGDPIEYRVNKFHEQDMLSFEYAVEYIEASFVKEEAEKLIHRVFAIQDIFQPYFWNEQNKSMGYDCQLAIVYYSDGQVNPEIILSASALAKLVALNGSLWIDAYHTDGDDDQEDEEDK